MSTRTWVPTSVKSQPPAVFLKNIQTTEVPGLTDARCTLLSRAKDITNLLQDEERLRQERRSRGAMQDRMAGVTRRSEDDDENLRRSVVPFLSKTRRETGPHDPDILSLAWAP